MAVAVIVPAYNEAKFIARALRGIPAFVDRVFVVDDASADDTSGEVMRVRDARISLIAHPSNRGVGAAIVTGYHAAREAGCDVLAVMAGDAQMHPDDLARLVGPVARREADYAKGDRFSHPDARRLMPRARYWGGRVLSFLTRRAAGLARLSDSQCGYTAIAAHALDSLALDRLWPRYGYPNDLLGQLAMARLRVLDVVVRPVYAGERSGLRPWHFLIMLLLIARVAARRAFSSRHALPAARSTMSSA